MALGLWHIISTTDVITKGVLLVLLGMSIACWALTIYKHLLFKLKIAQIKQAYKVVAPIRNLDEFLTKTVVFQTTFAGEIISQFLAEFKSILKIYDGNKKPMEDKDWYLLQANINQRLADTLHQEESVIPVLSTNAQVAPLIGLFGTVWGLIHAFMAIAQQRSADIAAVAPGIAEALITTLGGLVVAIPAVVMYNYLQNSARHLEFQLGALADKCLWIMRNATAEHDSYVTPHVSQKQAQRENL